VYLDHETLVARRFDPRRLKLEGDPIPLADAQRFEGSLGERHASVSDRGTVIFANTGNRNTRLAWIDPSTGATAQLASGPWANPRLSPDGRTIVAERSESGSQSNVWLIDAARGTAERFTSSRARERFPQWSHDGEEIAYGSNRDGRYDLYVKAVHGATEERRLATRPPVLLKWPSSWSSPASLVYTAFSPGTAYDVWVWSGAASDSGAARITSPANESDGVTSHDGRWLAYQSDQTGTYEVYVRRLLAGDTESIRVSEGGGSAPRFTPAGELIYYRPKTGEFCSVPLPPRPGPRRAILRVPGVVSYDIDSRGRWLCCIETPAQRDELVVLIDPRARPGGS
jgi:Tol biopolymer transport system component